MGTNKAIRVSKYQPRCKIFKESRIQTELCATFYNFMIAASGSNTKKSAEVSGGSQTGLNCNCLAQFCGLDNHIYGVHDCVKTLAKQQKQLMILFGNVVMKTKKETELVVDCQGETKVNLVTALGIYSRFGL